MRARSLLVLLLATPAAAHAQASQLEVQWPTGERNPAAAILAADLDDDNDDGVPDALEEPAPSPPRDDEVVPVVVTGVGRAVLRVRTEGGVRVVSPLGMLRDVAELGPGADRHVVHLVGVAASRAVNDAAVTFSVNGASVRVPLTVVGVSLLRGDNGIVWPHRDAVRISYAITNDPTLPRAATWAESSIDGDNVRAEVWDPGASRVGHLRIEAVGGAASVGVAPGAVRSALGEMVLDRPEDDLPLRSRFVRLVGDEMDLRAPGVQGQTLLVGLRDRVRVRYRRPGVAGQATADVAVGRPGNEDGPLAARRARWRLVVLRDRPGGRPVIGNDDAAAVRIAREQVAIANEIYLQCNVTFGEPASYPVTLADPPQNTLLAIGDDDGLRAGGGEIQVRVNGRALGPVRVATGWRPIETAEAIAAAARAAGFDARATVNRRTDYGADGSADVVVRDLRGHLAEITPVPGAPLTTDPQQSVSIGRVDLSDGLDEFNNLNSSSGTLEERTLLKSLVDDDVSTVDLFVINRFTHQTRIGEAFVEGDGGAIINALIVDRGGIAAQREAWTQSHEIGHIFLNQPWHPDNMGPDRPWLLMDADASLAAVTGPKRLSAEECRRLTAESGVGAVPSLLARYDEVRPSPRAPAFARWPEEDPYPRAARRAGAAPPSAAARTAPPDRPARDYGLRIE
jgi:hypothetical protein